LSTFTARRNHLLLLFTARRRLLLLLFTARCRLLLLLFTARRRLLLLLFTAAAGGIHKYFMNTTQMPYNRENALHRR
jgi:hypothetical protein